MELPAGAGPHKTSGREAQLALLYSLLLLGLNLYVCFPLLISPAAHMNSNHGQWIALAERGHAGWWPYWNAGMPIEYTGPPLVPAMGAAFASIRGVTPALGVETVTVVAYVLAPWALFLMAWRLTRNGGWSFLAGLVYSFTAVTQLFIPDGTLRLNLFWDHRRLFGMAVWDETPHVAAVACLPLIVLFLARSIETRRRIYYAATALFVAIALLSSWYAPTMIALAAIGLVVAKGRADWRKNALLAAGIGLWGWATAAPFLSPSALVALRDAISATPGEGWTPSSLTAIAIVVLSGAVVWETARRLTQNWAMRFFALLAWLYASIPITKAIFHRHFLPYSDHFKFEAEMAVCIFLVFALRPWSMRLPALIRRALLVVVLAFAVDQTAAFHQSAEVFAHTIPASQTVEYSAATWAYAKYPELRFAMPGSVSTWTNTFAPLQQFTVTNFTIWPSGTLQAADSALAEGDAQRSITWLKAFGVGAVGISSKSSEEVWKIFQRPEKYDGVLELLWSQRGVTFYKVPLRESGVAHVVPENALIRHVPRTSGDLKELSRYVAALDDTSLPSTTSQWDGRDRIRIHADAGAGQVLSIQEAWHPGWHATVDGQARRIQKDGAGLMWIRPECNGACDVVLDYDGGWELRLCRWLSYLAFAAIVIAGASGLRRRG
jgi:hypothetical protein